MIYAMMSSLGEMATYLPITGSINAYGTRFFDPALGFMLGKFNRCNLLSVQSSSCGDQAFSHTRFFITYSSRSFFHRLGLLVFLVNHFGNRVGGILCYHLVLGPTGEMSRLGLGVGLYRCLDLLELDDRQSLRRD